VATSTQPGEGQGQVSSAEPWEPRLSLELIAGRCVPMTMPGHTIKSQFVFPAQPGHGSAPMSDRAAFCQYRFPAQPGNGSASMSDRSALDRCGPGGCWPPPPDHEPVHLQLEEECMPDFAGAVNQGTATREDSYV
jgi:hypothetical protein